MRERSRSYECIYNDQSRIKSKQNRQSKRSSTRDQEWFTLYENMVQINTSQFGYVHLLDEKLLFCLHTNTTFGILCGLAVRAYVTRNTSLLVGSLRDIPTKA